MKQKLAGLLCLCMLLSGCDSAPSKPLQTESPTPESPTTESPTTQSPTTESPTTEVLPTQPNLPLLQQGIALEESSNLLYIPNIAVESMNAPEVRLLGNGLLLSECIGEELVLKHISLETGALVKESSVPSSPGTKLIIGSGEIGLCDRESGLISVLDESFRLLRTYEVPQEGDDWYLNSELDTLYVFYFDRGLLARNLQTGEAIWLVDNGFHVAAQGSTSS